MHDVSGVTGAAPIWLEVVNFLHRSRPSREPAVPSSLIATQVSFERDLEPARRELFVAGTALQRVAAKALTAARVSIAYPGEGTIIALDPDIPDEVQQVRFLSRPEAAGYGWRLDGAEVEEGMLWPPVPGRHELVLVNREGMEVDRVRFEVR
jgi:penicillin-binding protein 1C